MKRSLPNAFTLIELLVVISTIGVLVALTLPAVNAAREAARRTQCINNIRQVAIAAHGTVSARDQFPTGVFGEEHGWGPNSACWSWLARILPFIERADLYDYAGCFDQAFQDWDIPNEGAAELVSLYLCPTAANRETRTKLGNFEDSSTPLALCNYKGVSGANWGDDESVGNIDAMQNGGQFETDFRNEGKNGSYDGMNKGDGILWRMDYKKPVKTGDVRDGLSNTFLIGEDLPDYNSWCSWPYSNHAYGTCAIPPNYKRYDPVTKKLNTYNWQNTHSFRSAHPGGLNFAYGDASSGFVSDTIDMELYRALSTRNGKEIIERP